MPKLSVTNNNMFQKVNTGADYNRAIGVLNDSIVVVSSDQATSKLIPTGFKYLMGTNELEVYVNGVLKRRHDTYNGVVYGEYAEYTNFSVLFDSGVITTGSVVRFRITTANYKIINATGAGNSVDPTLFSQMQVTVAGLQSQVTSNANNIQQISKDTFGQNYVLSASTTGSTRTIGLISDSNTTPNLSGYRVWHTANTGTTIVNFLGGTCEDIRYIIFSNSSTIIKNNSNIVLMGGKDIIGFTGRTLTLLFDGSVWREIDSSGSSGAIVSASITSTSGWTLSGSLYYADIDISNINSYNYEVQCTDASTNRKIFPYRVESTTVDNVRVWMPTNTVTVNVVISG